MAGGGGGGVNSSWTFDPGEAQEWDGETADDVVLALPGMAPEVIVWGGNYYSLPPSRGWLVWDKKQNDSFTTGQGELAWSNLDRPLRIFRFAQCELATEGPKEHPTQKPVALMTWCLKWAKGQKILDPFMGSACSGTLARESGPQESSCASRVSISATSMTSRRLWLRESKRRLILDSTRTTGGTNGDQ